MASVKKYDCIIIGAGAAGLTAALYAVRRTLKTIVITKDLGGQASLAGTVENYPGLGEENGLKIMEQFKEQAEKNGAEIVFREVDEIEKGKDQFIVKTRDENYIGKTIILAFGLTPKDLGVPGEYELKNKGVSYCATCDAPLFKDKTVAVVGGGNSALDAAELLTKIAKKVYMIHRRGNFGGENVVLEKLKERDNIEVLLNTEITEIQGSNKVESIKIKDNQTNEANEIKCAGVFVEVGYIAKTDMVKDLVECNERKQIKIGRDCETSCPGVFAAGDVTDITYKQIVISAGEGAKAALQAYKFLQQKSGKNVGVDWGKST